MKASLPGRLAALLCGSLLGCGGGGGGGGGITGGGTPTSLFITPAAVNFGAVGSSKQLTTAYRDASNNVVNGAVAVFSLSGTGASASVSNSGLVTAIAPGQGVDTVVATGNGLTAKAPIFVTQVPAAIAVTSTSATPDTLFAASRQRQLSATVQDSNHNVISAPGSIAWSSNALSVATVGVSTGLVTAQGDGTASIQALVGGASGSRAIVVRRLPVSHSLTPPTASISTSGGSAGPFSASATDSASQPIPITWLSRSAAIFSVTNSTGASTSVNASGNGSAFLVTSIPAFPGGLDSSNITISGQPLIPSSVAITIGDDFYSSDHNGSNNNTVATVVDTVALNGTVTWSWGPGGSGTNAQHTVSSTGSPSFGSSSARLTGTFSVQFPLAGAYNYICTFHANMKGTIVVR